ncbi:TonB-dependent receptor [Oceanicoccus sp. KOV_DT_Chl]|uniref:TonB-dependent receptor n=1 Tax=Oceanicoccus sp. KOV_DT_Chl TaxID=1904639 RepID=UPI000C7B0E79|nr:TonB-dependent receptor [Oceanicoccus sp. KOV_DT_Chl]
MKRLSLASAISHASWLLCATAAAPSYAQEQANTLEEILVTAQKRLESVQDVPISMTVLSGEDMKSAGINDVNSLERVSPNLSFATSSDGGSSTAQAFVRGVGQFDFSITTDPGVAIYIDGVYQARTTGANIQFADIEYISVLRGPQGTLFGKNTIGGAIDIKTKVPTGNTSYSLETKVGSDNYLGFNGYFETPIIEDTLSASLTIMRNSSDGWQERPGRDAGDEDMWGGRAHLYWTPTDEFVSHLAIDGVWQEQNVYPRVLLAFDDTKAIPNLFNTYVAPCCTPNSDIDRSNINGSEDFDNLKTQGLGWTNEWENDNYSIKSITGYRHLNNDTNRQSDNTSTVDYQSTKNHIDQEQYSQELIFSGYALNDRLDWAAGLYYFQEKSSQISNVNVAAGLYDALTVTPLAPIASSVDFELFYDRQQETESAAAYVHTIYEMTDSLKLTVAGRFTYEAKELDVESLKKGSQAPILALGPTDPDVCTDVTAWGVGSQFSCDESWTAFSPLVGLDWQVTQDVMTYVRASRGFRSGVFNGRPTSSSQISVADPEYLTSYELGYKTDLANGRLRINGAIFYNDYEDQQFLVNRASASASSALSLVVDNAGKSSLSGVELEFSYLPIDGFTVNGSVGYINPEYDEFDTLAADPLNPVNLLSKIVLTAPSRIRLSLLAT